MQTLNIPFIGETPAVPIYLATAAGLGAFLSVYLYQFAQIQTEGMK